jgi:hypothetical protein
MANKLARIAWSVRPNDKAFDTHLETGVTSRRLDRARD